jgi:hypothetical protein
VKFDKPLEINTYVSPICLPTREPNLDDFCAVVGWGATLGEYISLLIGDTYVLISNGLSNFTKVMSLFRMLLDGFGNLITLLILRT